MDNYEKKIRYLDYLEYGTKEKNGGFLKTELDGDLCRVQVNIRGLYPTDTLPADIVLYGGGKGYRVDRINLQYGTGSYAAVWNVHNMAGCEMTYAEWSGVEIVLAEHRRLRSIWASAPQAIIKSVELKEVEEVEEGKRKEKSEEQRAENRVENQAENRAEKPVDTQLRAAENIMEEADALPGEGAVLEEPVLEEPVLEESVLEEPGLVELGLGEFEKQPFAELYEDKWTQLEQYYKRIRPFGDRRSYLSISPRDFIVLGKGYQKLVSNSFLLHGYYNYGHVVLGRVTEGDSYRYYLGVPGVYHEREKQVAKMFGFEGFEGAAEPSLEGGFGYYMTPVEI